MLGANPSVCRKIYSTERKSGLCMWYGGQRGVTEEKSSLQRQAATGHQPFSASLSLYLRAYSLARETTNRCVHVWYEEIDSVAQSYRADLA